ncbi:hypothetical protein [Effusibacillus consociatus]|uniref:Uncharacterized protein n=1 Tax=Effusibacillus consociatus TaxID=1117041 RepID=A0ABV9Q0Y8_9BACL
MKRKWIAGGLLAIVFGISWGLSGGQASSDDLRETKARTALQNQYKGVDPEDIRFGEWKPLPLPTDLPTVEQRQQELSKIEQKAAPIRKEKSEAEAAIADGQRAIKAVETDFSNGKLSKADADMLVKLFGEKVDKYKVTNDQLKESLSKLETRKQELLAYKELDTIVYTQAAINKGLMTYRKNVFFNTVQQRLLTEEEIKNHPMAVKLNVPASSTISAQTIKNLILAGGISAIILILVYYWRTSKTAGSRMTRVNMVNPKA